MLFFSFFLLLPIFFHNLVFGLSVWSNLGPRLLFKAIFKAFFNLILSHFQLQFRSFLLQFLSLISSIFSRRSSCNSHNEEKKASNFHPFLPFLLPLIQNSKETLNMHYASAHKRAKTHLCVTINSPYFPPEKRSKVTQNCLILVLFLFPSSFNGMLKLRKIVS